MRCQLWWRNHSDTQAAQGLNSSSSCMSSNSSCRIRKKTCKARPWFQRWLCRNPVISGLLSSMPRR